jgi:hypothetical protein
VLATTHVPSLYSWLVGGQQPTVSAKSIAGGRYPIDNVPQGGVYPIVIGFHDLQPADSPDGAGEIGLDSLQAGEKFYFEVQSNAAWSAVGSSNQSAVRQAQLAYGQPSLANQSFHVGTAGGAAACAVGGKAICSTDYLSECEHNGDSGGPGLSELPVGTVLLCPLVDQVATGGDLKIAGFVLLKLLGNDGNYGHVLYTSEIVRTVVPVGHSTGKDLGSFAAWENKNSPLPECVIQ